jgi:hypothetical protein
MSNKSEKGGHEGHFEVLPMPYGELAERKKVRGCLVKSFKN